MVLAMNTCNREVIANIMQALYESTRLPEEVTHHFFAAWLLSITAMVGCAVVCVATKNTSRQRPSWREWVKLGGGIVGLTGVAGFAAWDILLSPSYERMGIKDVAIVWCSFGTAALPFTISVLAFRQHNFFKMLWILTLSLGCPLLLIIRWKLRLPMELNELVGVWLVTGYLGYIWANTWSQSREADAIAN